MDIGAIEQVASSQFAYLILFIGLLVYVIKASDKRELQMREQLNKTVPILDKILTRLDNIEEKIENKGGN